MLNRASMGEHKENQSVGDLNHSHCSSSHMWQRYFRASQVIPLSGQHHNRYMRLYNGINGQTAARSL